MTKMIFINLPVRALAEAREFYGAIGATQNTQFSDERSNCMMISETIGVMLLTHERYGEFTSRPIGDARLYSQALLALTFASRDEVDRTVEKAVAAGGKADPNPVQDLGFMYNRTIEDPDGNVWEIFWMDPATVAGEPT
ncbi:MAG: VOC family protein [Allorhizobium sp.]